jgi:four helix bundle protein
MAYKSFEENLSWKKAQELTVAIFGVFQNCSETWFKDELLGSALHAAGHIAKGHDGKADENIRCLTLAKDSLTKCRSMLLMATKLKLCKESEAQLLQEKVTDASKLLYGFMKHLKEKTASAA